MFHNGMFGGGMWFGWVFWIILVGVVIYFISKMSGRNDSVGNKTEDSPLNILNKRYANGEINKEEYLKIKNDLIKDQ